MFNTKWSTWPFAPPNTKWWRHQCHHNTSTIVEKFSPLLSTRGDVGSLTPFPATKWWQTLNLLNVLNKQDFKFSQIAQILHFGQQNWEWRRLYHSTLKKFNLFTQIQINVRCFVNTYNNFSLNSTNYTIKGNFSP